MTDISQDIVQIIAQVSARAFPIRSTTQQLIETRRLLAQKMIVRVGGFHYESFFGCNDPDSTVPYVIVRVQMCPFREDTDDAYHFEVSVDFNLFQGVNVKEAENLKRQIDRAVKLSQWAQDIVRGLVWDAKTIASLEIVNG